MAYFPKTTLPAEWTYEALASYFFVLAALSVVATTGGGLGYVGNPSQIIYVALALGATYGALINAFPTAHILPTNTLGVLFDEIICAIWGKVSWWWVARLIVTWIIQILAGLLAALTTWIFIDESVTDLGQPKDSSPHQARHFFTIATWTAVVTVAYLWSIMNVAPLYEQANKKGKAGKAAYANLSRGLSNGVILMVVNFATITVTGGIVNPVRWLSAAIVSNTYDHNWWSFIFAPFAGGLIGYVVYLIIAGVATWKIFTQIDARARKAAAKGRKRIMPERNE